jgi:dihydrofolate synthase/folylpolyglutamate synthase
VDYQESLDYLYGLQRFGIKLGLENIRTLLERLGRPEERFGILHVGGTNGKGSVCASLAEILRRAGYRVGLYTSPHLHSFTERIRVDGRPIDEAEVARLTDEIRRLAPDVPATFFEFTTALALCHFQREEVDFAVLEVGMGGRLDATNAVVPRVAVITPVCRDHAEHLGGDLATIAGEKAGIVKPGVPVVIGPQEPAAFHVLAERAREQGAPLFAFGRDFFMEKAPEGLSYRDQTGRLEGLRPGLAGAHQHENLALALCAAGVLHRQGVALADEALRAGVEAVRWPGRLEWWADDREILLDGAHNEGGARVLAAFLRELKPAGIRWVVGMKADKRPQDILGPLLPLASALYCTVPPVEEAVGAAGLVRLATPSGVRARAFVSPGKALDAALADRRPGEIVLVAGSLFLVAAAREALMQS